MTKRNLETALKRINDCKQNGYLLEALLRNYELNLALVKLMIQRARPDYDFEGKKIKTIIRDFNDELGANPELKAIINKKAFGLVKTWLSKMDSYFKALKLGKLSGATVLLSETEKISGVLTISVRKFFA